MLFIKGKKKSFQQWLKPKMILFGSWNVSKIAIKATVGFYCERQEKEEAYFSPCPIWWSKSSNWCSIYMWRYVTNCVLHPDTLTHTQKTDLPWQRGFCEGACPQSELVELRSQFLNILCQLRLDKTISLHHCLWYYMPKKWNDYPTPLYH